MLFREKTDSAGLFFDILAAYMKVVIQRVSEASVTIDGEVYGAIGKGFLLLTGIEDSDTEEVVQKVADKVARMRIFDDEHGKMNLSLAQVGGAILSISQFTLFADCAKGNRPSFDKAGKPEHAKKLYLHFNEVLRSYGYQVEEGIFAADMKVRLLNDGPITIVLDSHELKGGCAHGKDHLRK